MASSAWLSNQRNGWIFCVTVPCRLLDLREILVREERADLDVGRLVVRIGTALQPFHRFLHRLDFPQPVAGDQLLGFGEGSIDHGAVLAGEADALALGGRMQSG